MTRKKKILIFSIIGVLLIISIAGISVFKKYNFNRDYLVGEPVDSLHGVNVYYNGGVDHVAGRNLTEDGYNLGLKYQCVEFVKRYYYEHLNHKMPDSYGHAKDFFDSRLRDGEINRARDLLQYTNPSKTRPEIGDLLIFGPTAYNRYGHVAIISRVGENEVEIIQQNPGPFGKSRQTYNLNNQSEEWEIENERILGRLRKEQSQ